MSIRSRKLGRSRPAAGVSDTAPRPFSFSLLDTPGRDPVAIAVAAAAEGDVLGAVAAAHGRRLIDPILVADADQLARVADEEEIDITGMTVENVTDMEAASRRAVSIVAAGEAAMLMKGLVDTSVLLHAVLDRENGLRAGSVLSHLALFEIEGYPRPLAITDAAMNIAPGYETKRAILENAVSFLHALGYREPKVAVLAAKEKVNERMSATVDAAALTEANRRGEITGCIVDGPFALDNAVSVEAARIKGIDSPVAGEADILLAPQIESGNVLYKALAFLAPSRNAGVIVGARAPIVLTSRADSREAKLDSIALAALAAGATRT
ncbi:MAG: bifunctional enoyl-CoA hydratase/phosphate acetyltransferase [Spirochaetales bacterium]|nr:bifunctional enoyl-CoA hydratase/phosphate acetyltransferase [Spirochaetales bacterium]